MSNLDKDIEILKSIVKVHKDFLKGCNKETISEKEIQAIENVLWALNGKDCVIETQSHNEEVLEKYIAKLEEELKTYKKIVDNAQEQIELAERTYDIEELNPYARGMYDAFKMVIDWARKEVTDTNVGELGKEVEK